MKYWNRFHGSVPISSLRAAEPGRSGRSAREHDRDGCEEMFKRGEEESINAPSAAALPCSPTAAIPRAGRAIAVAGEAIVDFVLEPGGGTTPHLGGLFVQRGSHARPARVAAGVHRAAIERPVRERSSHALEESGVNLDGIVMTDDPTTFARVEIDGYGTASYRFYIEGTSTAGLLPEEARSAMPARPGALHVGGLGMAVEPQAGAIAALVCDASPDTLVLVDPNCRAQSLRADRLLRPDTRPGAPGRRRQGERGGSRVPRPGPDAAPDRARSARARSVGGAADQRQPQHRVLTERREAFSRGRASRSSTRSERATPSARRGSGGGWPTGSDVRTSATSRRSADRRVRRDRGGPDL